MFSPIKGKQTTFVYGPEIYEKLVSRDHLLYKINESIDFTFINEECRNLYSENMGRPVTNTPEIMFRSAIIQSLNDYSDREMESEARYNIMVKWFIGLNLDDSSYDRSALGRFRDLLGEERWKEIFFSLLKQIENAGFVKGKESVLSLIYTSDAADEEDSVDIGGRRIIKKKKKK